MSRAQAGKTTMRFHFGYLSQLDWQRTHPTNLAQPDFGLSCFVPSHVIVLCGLASKLRQVAAVQGAFLFF